MPSEAWQFKDSTVALILYPQLCTFLQSLMHLGYSASHMVSHGRRGMPVYMHSHTMQSFSDFRWCQSGPCHVVQNRQGLLQKQFLWQMANECSSVASERNSQPSELTSEDSELNFDIWELSFDAKDLSSGASDPFLFFTWTCFIFDLRSTNSFMANFM